MAFSIPKIREEYCHNIGYPTGPPSYLGTYIVTNCSAGSRPRGEGMGGGGGADKTVFFQKMGGRHPARGGGGGGGGGGSPKQFFV